jgi:hypothetical protein
MVPEQPFRPVMNPPAESFDAIANRPDTTAASVIAFLKARHEPPRTAKDMPALRITRNQERQVAAYIMSLKTAR